MDSETLDSQSQGKPRWRAAWAYFMAWAVAAGINAASIAALPMPATGFWTRLLHHTYDIGHFAALGLLSALAVVGLERIGRSRAWLGVAALSALALGVGALLLPDEVIILTRRFDAPQGQVLVALVVVVSGFVPMALVAGRLAAGRFVVPGWVHRVITHRLGDLTRWVPFTRWVAITVGAFVLAVNNYVVPSEHRSGHAFVAWAAATLIGAALTGARLPTSWVPRRRVRRGITVSLLALALWSVLAPPSQNVKVQLSLLDGSVVVSPLSRIRATTRSTAHRSAAGTGRFATWAGDRHSLPEVEPGEAVVPADDAIVLMIFVDSIRSELLMDPKYRERLPNMWSLRDRGVMFSSARSPGSGTRNTLGSVFSGKYRTQLNWRYVKNLVYTLRDDGTEQLAQTLTKAGVATEHSVSYKYLQKRFKVLKGFAEEHYEDPIEGQKHSLSDVMLAPLKARLVDPPSGRMFYFAHLMDPHYPYDAGGTEGSPWDRYIAEVAYCDREIGALWKHIVRLGLEHRIVLILSGDHGEGFGQHNTKYHQTTVYDELVHVPLLVVAPGVEARVVQDPVSLLDLGPTTLDLLGVATPGAHMGQSLVPYLRGETPELTRPVGGITLLGKSLVYYLMVDTDTKVIVNEKFGTREVYNLEADPGEKDNQYDDLGDVGEQYVHSLMAFYESHVKHIAPKSKKKRSRAPKTGN